MKIVAGSTSSGDLTTNTNVHITKRFGESMIRQILQHLDFLNLVLHHILLEVRCVQEMEHIHHPRSLRFGVLHERHKPKSKIYLIMYKNFLHD